jgi:FSR family fosmidomycin resistance protein-like MFS transporter
MKKNSFSFALLALFAIELLDEFVYGAREAAWPQIRDDLSLSYTEIGLLLSIPPIVGNLIEPALGLLGNSPKKRRGLIVGGGFVFALALVLYSLTDSFWVFLFAASLCSPASGAFVALSQVSLMDAEPERREKNMARWTMAGFIGVVVGPLVLSLMVALGYSWRGFFVLTAALMLSLTWVVWRHPFHIPKEEDEPKEEAWIALKKALQNPEVLRCVLLLEVSDFMMDIFYGFLALYLVDVLHVNEAQAGLGVVVWTVSSLLGDSLLMVFIERINTTKYIRASALFCMFIFALFQFAPSLWSAFILLALLGASRTGWYPILGARLYDALPGNSGIVLSLTNIFNFVSALVPLGLGLLAEKFGLWTTLWVLLLGPLAIFLGVRPKPEQRSQRDENG